MRTRHKIPTIFNLSMVDVLCCALGCVILLWLVNFREAKRRTLAVGETATRLDTATLELAAFRQRLIETERQRGDLQGERDAALMTAELTARERERVRAQLAAVEGRLELKSQDARTLARDLALTEKERAALQALLRDKDALARAAAKDAEGLNARLKDADALAAKLRALADRLPGLEKDLAGLRDKSADSTTRLVALERDLLERTKELASARALADDLRSDKKLLTVQVARARADAENRFAGIALTGKRVIFLVDMSGSMEFSDEQTPAPDKWQGVAETLGKIARSLPELDKFQVIGFTKDASFVLGGEGRWLDFDPKTSADRATQALLTIKPKGATNMYAAFDAAFRYRALGLDTIYVLSDGLPNIGTGLAPEQALKMKEHEKSEVLGNYVRKTLTTTWNRPGLDKSRVRINTVGFFYESPSVGAFLWALARENDGSFVGMSKP